MIIPNYLYFMMSIMKRIVLFTMLTAVSGLTLASGNAANWNGFYAGGNLGYGWGETNDVKNAGAAKQDIDGFSGGLQAGHNWQLENNVVIGVETSLSFNDVKENWKDRDNNEFSPYYGEDAVKGAGSFTVKAGYAVDQFLPYVIAGVTVAKMDHKLGCDKSLVSATKGCKEAEYQTSQNDISFGATVGAGVSYKIADNLSTGLEYLYTDLGKSTVYLADPNYPKAGEREFKTSYSTTTLKLNYHF